MKSKERIARMIARGSSRRWRSTLQQRAVRILWASTARPEGTGRRPIRYEIRDTGYGDAAPRTGLDSALSALRRTHGRKIAFVSDFLENESLKRESPRRELARVFVGAAFDRRDRDRVMTK